MTTLKTRLMGGLTPYAPLGPATMLRGPVVPRYPDDDPPAPNGDDPPAETVDKAVHDRIVAAHDALKRDRNPDNPACSSPSSS